MKAIKIIFISILSFALCFLACDGDSDTGNGEDPKKESDDEIIIDDQDTARFGIIIDDQDTARFIVVTDDKDSKRASIIIDDQDTAFIEVVRGKPDPINEQDDDKD